MVSSEFRGRATIQRNRIRAAEQRLGNCQLLQALDKVPINGLADEAEP